jgi:glycosyltransferase involved in cell wall biosynthesis
MSKRHRVLVIVQGRIGDNPAGPEIRGWEMARAFAARHDVTIVADTEVEHEREGIRIVPRSRRRLVAEARRHEIVIGPLLPPYLMLAMAGRRKVRVADLYDPVDLELSTLGEHWRARRLLAQRRILNVLQLRSADVVACANEPQRERIVEELDGSGRRDGGPALTVAPMGLPGVPPPSTGHPLRDRFPAIGDSDPVVLWWGSVWRWLDAPTAIRAIGVLAARRPDVRFVITAGPPPNELTGELNATEEARIVARDLGLLDRHVFFLEEWVPFAERHAWLRDADVGLTVHAESEESPLAARARYMDYIWAGLPAVLARGDVVADQMAAAGAARLVDPGDPEGTADALEALLADPAALAEARTACARLAEDLRWDHVLQPLVAEVEGLARDGGSLGHALRLGRDAASFYALRVVNSCIGVS